MEFTPDSPDDRRAASTGGSRTGRYQWAIFLLINGGILMVMFWPAIMGRAMLAPLDLAPNLFSKYRYVDPSATGVPANHHVIDLLFGDLSRNLLVYEAWQRGEMPWWDPYTDGGKPLGAEANAVNISDPFKVVLFHALRFEPAYNWIRIIPFFLSGLSAFLLLRHFDFGFMASVWGGLLYEFAGCNFVMFSGPTVQAGFAYYPILWLLWDVALRRKRFFWFALSSLVAALIFLSGNLQSHSYVFLFAIAFITGYGWKRVERWRLLLSGTGCALFLGLCLSTPFVLPQVELFFLSARKLHPPVHLVNYLSGLASTATLFPWVLGTFRTPDLSKLLGQQLLGFWIYVGSAALVIAMIGFTRGSEHQSANAEIQRTAMILIVVYFIICSTPLLQVLYTRPAWLAVLGIVVLFARGWSFLARNRIPLKAWAHGLLICAALTIVVLNVFALVVYPRIEPKIAARYFAAQQGNPSLDVAEPLRRFQVRNYPAEVSVKNPETVLAFCGILFLAWFLLKPTIPPRLALNAILVLSTLPLLMFGHRYIPMQPFALWERLREGGPEQQQVAAELRPGHLRLMDLAPGGHDRLFPGAMAQLFKVHTLQGYSSLTIRNALFLADSSGRVPPAYYDYEYHSWSRGLERGELVPSANHGISRFRWSDDSSRKISVKSETLTKLTLGLEDGNAGDLIRSDSFYPGWRAFSDSRELKLTFEPPCFTRIHIPAGVKDLRFSYQPRPWHLSLWIASVAGVILALLMMTTYNRKAN